MEVWCYSKISEIDCLLKKYNNPKVGITPLLDPKYIFESVGKAHLQCCNILDNITFK